MLIIVFKSESLESLATYCKPIIDHYGTYGCGVACGGGT